MSAISIQFRGSPSIKWIDEDNATSSLEVMEFRVNQAISVAVCPVAVWAIGRMEPTLTERGLALDRACRDFGRHCEEEARKQLKAMGHVLPK